MILTTSEQAYRSRSDQLNDTVTETEYDWISLDGHFLLDSDKVLMGEITDSYQVGFISSAISDSLGNFSSPPFITWDLEETKFIKEVSISFENTKLEYAVNYAVYAYNLGSLVMTIPINNSTLMSNTIPIGIQIDKVRVDINTWSHPYKSAKILECVYLRDIILFSANITGESNLTSAAKRLRTNRSNITGESNLSIKYNRIQPHRSNIAGEANSIINTVKFKGLRLYNIACESKLDINTLRLISFKGPLEITSDNYRKKENPVDSSSLANYIVVTTYPRSTSDTVDLYTTTESVSGSVQIIANYSDDNSPALEGAIVLRQADEDVLPLYTSVVSAFFYSWGAVINLVSTNPEEVRITITGKYLMVTGSQAIPSSDDTSIRENGTIKYVMEENYLVQNSTVAKNIADTLLASYKDPRRDVKLSWRGNQAVELGDKIKCYEFGRPSGFAVTKQVLSYDGTLTASLTGRKVDLEED